MAKPASRSMPASTQRRMTEAAHLQHDKLRLCLSCFCDTEACWGLPLQFASGDWCCLGGMASARQKCARGEGFLYARQEGLHSPVARLVDHQALGVM